MPGNFKCQCSICFPGKHFRSQRTIKEHLDADVTALQQAQLQQNHRLCNLLERFIDLNRSELSRDREKQEAPLLSSNPALPAEELDPVPSIDLISQELQASSSDSESELSDSGDSVFSAISKSGQSTDADLEHSEIYGTSHPDGQSFATGNHSDIEDTVVDPTVEESELSIPPNITIPESLTQLQNKLRNGYSPLPIPPSSAKLETQLNDLTRDDVLSLQHYIAWSESNGTVKAYKKHAQVLEQATGSKILSLHQVRMLASRLVSFAPEKIDMCPKSCVAYTGSYADLLTCPECEQPRFRFTKTGKPKRRAYYQYLPITPSLRAMYSSSEAAQQLRYRSEQLKEALRCSKEGSPGRKFSDYADGLVHQIHFEENGLFQDERDVALAISTDGAQLTMKKQSNCWLLIIVLLNLPPDIRYKTQSVIINLSIPGPRSPVDIETFLYPMFEELARGHEGVWMWDNISQGYFLCRFYCCMGLGDMLGSAKISGMAGHTAVYGDRFSTVKGARTSPGTKAQYYPINPPENEEKTLNPGRPLVDLDNIPIRSESDYWKTIIMLDYAKNPTVQAKIVRRTGVSRLPLCATSPAFLHPVFFPIDPFHLFYENCMTFIWDTWVSSRDRELIYVPPSKLANLGELIEGANRTLPPSLSGPIRNTQTKRNSQYKVFEWMAVLHWYIIPIGIEIGLNTLVLQNFAQFVGIVEFAMTPIPRSEEELEHLQRNVNNFLHQYEQLYVDNKPTNIKRMRLCIFQLVHIPRHIKWNGSIRVGSQATVERKIGEMSHRIRSKKSPFANLANQIYERELIRILLLHFPSLHAESHNNATLPHAQTANAYRCMQKHTWTKKARKQLQTHVDALAECLEHDQIRGSLTSSNVADAIVRRWGKLKLPNKRVLRSALGESSPSSRQYRWFEAENISIVDAERRKLSTNIIFGEAVSFYEIKIGAITRCYVVYTPLEQRSELFGLYTRGVWGSSVRALSVSWIRDIVGIWSPPSKPRVYILRKHPGLSLLTPEELGQKQDLEDQNESDVDESGDDDSECQYFDRD